MKIGRLSIFLYFLFIFSAYAQVEIHVSPTGGDRARGTLKKPTSLQKAIETVAKKSRSMKSDIIVYLHEGRYELSSPMILDERHSGKNGYKVIFKAYQDELPVISGGTQVSRWEKVDGQVYKAHLDRNTKLRSLFVNGQRMRMAGTEVPVAGLGDWGQFAIQGDEEWAFGAGSGIAGIKFPAAEVKPLERPEDVELVQFNIWTEKILCAQDMAQDGDTTIIQLQQPYGAIATSMAWAGKINYNKNFIIRNARELLDTPGEFYFDKSEHILLQ